MTGRVEQTAGRKILGRVIVRFIVEAENPVDDTATPVERHAAARSAHAPDDPATRTIDRPDDRKLV
ncbi:MAG: hypothetical protein VB859_17480, partial [Planctomycetaceae bacterium]